MATLTIDAATGALIVNGDKLFPLIRLRRAAARWQDPHNTDAWTEVAQ
jgi:hypothetical protein